MWASGLPRSACSGCPPTRGPERAAIEKARYWLEKIGLIERADDPAGELPYGGQRRLEIARAMRTDPVLLSLMSRPPVSIRRRVPSSGPFFMPIRDEHVISILLIEHDMTVVMEISDYVVVLDDGHKDRRRHPEEDLQRSEGDRGLSRGRGGRGRSHPRRDAGMRAAPAHEVTVKAQPRRRCCCAHRNERMGRVCQSRDLSHPPGLVRRAFRGRRRHPIPGAPLGQRLEQRLGKPFVIENRPGGGGVTGAVRSRVRPRTVTRFSLRRLRSWQSMSACTRSFRMIPPPTSCRSPWPTQPLCARRYPFAPGAIGAGTHQARQGQAAANWRLLGRRRHASSSLSASVSEQDRHRDDAYSLPRLGARPHRRRGRTCSAHVQPYPAGPEPDQRRKGASDRRFHQRARRPLPHSCPLRNRALQTSTRHRDRWWSRPPPRRRTLFSACTRRSRSSWSSPRSRSTS